MINLKENNIGTASLLFSLSLEGFRVVNLRLKRLRVKYSFFKTENAPFRRDFVENAPFYLVSEEGLRFSISYAKLSQLNDVFIFIDSVCAYFSNTPKPTTLTIHRTFSLACVKPANNCAVVPTSNICTQFSRRNAFFKDFNTDEDFSQTIEAPLEVKVKRLCQNVISRLLIIFSDLDGAINSKMNDDYRKFLEIQHM